MNTNFEKSYPLPQGIVYNAEKNWYELVPDAADDRLDVLDYYGEMWDCWQKAMQVAAEAENKPKPKPLLNTPWPESEFIGIDPAEPGGDYSVDLTVTELENLNPELLKPELKSTACLRFLGRLPCHCDFCLENNHE